MKMSVTIKACAGITFLLTLTFIALRCPIPAISCGTACYHFCMRLAVGYAVNGIMKNRADYTAKWFQLRKWETALYRKLRVRKWKKHLPSYDPSLFDLKKHSLDAIVQAMCQAEIVHEIIVILSFIPLFFSILFDSFAVFFITSLLSACFDLCFVILQRYNRPRLIKLIAKQ